MDTATEELRSTSIDGLLTAAFALTHRLDAAQRNWKGDYAAREVSIREQRDLIVAEIKRRVNEPPF